ncbi:M14 family zinc carboxypeptidase [Ornithinimicrobium flavum]|uniref:M14 family zinc carboxypeptidase n=1 Tax=Ornithinimicrobium flavum TaxID=1288636 RepID=UPI001930FBA1|nr:M14 family zinc carboxypeptidase [Ornithinimicrobium flavum]
MTRARRPVALATSLATAAGLALTTAPPIAASPTAVPPTAAVLPAHPVLDEGFPRRTPLVEPPADPADAALRLGLSPWHDVVRRLNDAQESSDRVSVQVVGRSTEGRDLMLVTLTAPESPAEARQQQRMRDRLTEQPAQAARDRGLARSYKLPVLVNANIHGNEWEGTDAVLRLVEEYAASRDPQVARLLERHRIHLLVSANPDGRVAGTRRNPAGFDLNRDLVTGSQPETVALRDVIVETQPALVVDLHGYVNGTLVEPTTPPHGEAYETDLLLPHAYPLALAVEEAVLGLGHDEDDGVRPPQIPLRDWAEGWDGWPPIFVPQYSQLHGAVASTVELPLRVNNSAYELGTAELQRRAAINTEIAHAAITATLGYAGQHREELLADQVEIFRRGVTGARQVPVEDGLFGVVGPEDVFLTQYPRAYVIPTGDGQRSAPAAARLVDLLLAHDVEVTRLSRGSTISGRSYPAGSYVVDLHQAKRAVAHTLLGRGSDISGRVDAMYDISGWSHGLLWGADVVTVPESSPLRIVGTPVERAAASGSLDPSSTGWVLPLADPADVAATSTLLEHGVTVELLDDGTVLVPPGRRGPPARSPGSTAWSSPVPPRGPPGHRCHPPPGGWGSPRPRRSAGPSPRWGSRSSR